MTDCEHKELECEHMGSMGICLKEFGGTDYCPGTGSIVIPPKKKKSRFCSYCGRVLWDSKGDRIDKGCCYKCWCDMHD